MGEEQREDRRPRPHQHHPAAVRRRDRPGERQPEPGPPGRPADTALDDPRHQFLRYALPLVPDLDDHRPRRQRRPDRDRSAAVHERVVQQRGDHLSRAPQRDVGVQALLSRHLQLPAQPPECRLPLHDLLRDDVVDAGQGGRARPAAPGPPRRPGDGPPPPPRATASSASEPITPSPPVTWPTTNESSAATVTVKSLVEYLPVIVSSAGGLLPTTVRPPPRWVMIT